MEFDSARRIERPGMPRLKNAEPLWSVEKVRTSIAASNASAARVRSAEAFAGFWVNGNGFDIANPHAARREFIAVLLELLLDGARKSRLDKNQVRHPLLVEARRVVALLRAHPEPGPIQNVQKCGGNNARAARGAGDEAQFAIPKNNRGNHGAERPVSRRDGVGSGLQKAEHIRLAGSAGEIVHFVVEQKAVGSGHTGAVKIVERVGVGNGVALRVHDGKMRGVRVL